MSAYQSEQKPTLLMAEHKIKENSEDYDFADEIWNFENFKRKFRIVVVRDDENDLEFDMIGATPSLSNAFRRLMLSEVPSMAIEKVYIYNNTSVIPDEVLAHRIGLLPLNFDPKYFEYRDADAPEEGTEHDTLEFELKVKCTRKNKEVKEMTGNLDSMYYNHSIKSGQIKWVPKGNQTAIFKDTTTATIDDDILISKMRPGHELDLKLLAVKGVGKDHAKFSPVATAFYRLLPEILLNREVRGRDAHLLQKCFSPGVIGIDEHEVAYVKDARYDSCSRNIYRYPQLADAATITRVRNHFIFTVESLGAIKPEVIFVEAIKCLKVKCRLFLDELKVE